MTKKKTKGKQSDHIQHRVGVYCTESDLKDDTVVFLAAQCGILTPNDYDIVDVGNDEKPEKKIVVKEYSEKNHAEQPALTIMQGEGTIKREDSERNLLYNKSIINTNKKTENNIY